MEGEVEIKMTDEVHYCFCGEYASKFVNNVVNGIPMEVCESYPWCCESRDVRDCLK